MAAEEIRAILAASDLGPATDPVIAGAGALAQETGEDPAGLRRDVTSPNGTTQAGLGVLMAELPDLVRRTVRAVASGVVWPSL